MGAAGSTSQNKESDATSSVATKVGAARALGEYTPNSHPENHNQVDPLLPDTFPTLDSGSPDMSCLHINHLSPQSHCPPVCPVTQTDQSTSSTQVTQEPQISVLQLKPTSGHPIRRFSVERSLSADNPQRCGGPEGCVSLKSSRVYIIEREGKMTVGGHSSKESLELDVLQVSKEQAQCQELNRNQTTQPAHGSHHHSSHRRSSHQHSLQHQTGPRLYSQPLQSSGSTNSIQDWGIKKSGSQEEYTTDCVACIRAPCQSQRSLDLDTSLLYGAKPCRKLERMYSEDRTSTEDKDDNPNSWFPKENMLSFQTATTTMQAISNFRKHLRMVGSRRGKPQTFADRRAKTFSRSWSDPTPVKPDCLHDSRDSADLQSSSGTLDDRLEYTDWEREREMERLACDGEDFIPPKIMLISSKVPKAKYVPDIIRRDDPSIIPILYDHEHATFDDILDEVEKKLTAYRKGCKIWNMLIFCQGGPGHLYLLKNKVATFAKVEKEEDMIQFWRRLSRLMSKLNPKPNFIHIMGCYVLGSTNGEKLIQTLKRLMRPSSVEFKSPLELSTQGKEMIEMYFDFRLFRLWKSRQHSKLLDYDYLL